MIAVDSSIVVAAFASWHELHEGARLILDGRPAAIGHVIVESYSVLTRLPPPHRAAPLLVRDFLAQRFLDPYLVLSGERLHDLLPDIIDAGVKGGASYDALIALTAREYGAELLSADRRAKMTYDVLGVRSRLI